MNTQVVLLAAVCLSLVSAAAAGASKTTTTRPPKVACGFANMEKCCPNMPAIFSAASLTKCMATPTTVMEEAGKCTVDEIGEISGYNCAMECLFKENAYLTATGTVDLVALNASLKGLETSAPTWATALKAAEAKCTVKAPKATKKPCVSGSSTVATCIYSKLMSLCPTPDTTTVCKGFFGKSG